VFLVVELADRINGVLFVFWMAQWFDMLHGLFIMSIDKVTKNDGIEYIVFDFPFNLFDVMSFMLLRECTIQATILFYLSNTFDT
jgi:hypothetical protein